MSDQVSIVTMDSPASPGNVDFVSSEITDTVMAAIFIYGATLTDGSAQSHAALGIAFWADDGAVNSPGSFFQSSLFSRALDAETGTMDARGFKDSTNVLQTIERDTTPATDLVADTVTKISGGLRVHFATTTSRSRITCILFAGVARAWADVTNATTVSSHRDTGGSSHQFQPDLLIVAGSDGNYGALVDDFWPQLGFVVGSVHSGATIDMDRGTNPPDGDGRVDGVGIPFITPNTGGTLQVVTFSIDSTGYNKQVTTGAGSPDFSVLAIKFADAGTLRMCANKAVGAGASQSLATGFPPRFVFGMSTLIASENTTTDGTTAAGAGFFAFKQTAARAYAASHQEGTSQSVGSPGVSKSIQGDFAVLTLTHLGVVAQQATLASITSTGFTLAFSTATAGFLTFLAIGSIDGSDTEQISETLAFRRAESSSDTERVTETLAFRSSQPSLDTERISDQVAFRRGESSLDTERITEALAFRRGESQGETERISESALLLASLFEPVTGLQTAGAVFEASAVKGETIVALARSGAVWEAAAEAGEVEGGGGGAVAGVVEGG